jgi:hypothetical protein
MAALLFVLLQPAPAHAEAIWSYDASVINALNPGAALPFGSVGTISNNFSGTSVVNGFLTLGNGNGYTFAATFNETTTPGLLGSTASAFIGVTMTITANAGNVGNISDTMAFYSDFFPGTGAPIQGYVGMIGSFSGPRGVGAVQAQLNYNGTAGVFPASEYLRTATVINPGANVLFNTYVAAPIVVSTNELTGLLAFTLAPGEKLTLPFDFTDNVPLQPMGFVPEPNSMVLLALGVIPLAMVARRRRNRSKAPVAGPTHDREIVV